ncbi:MAG: M1 family metallopeptidase, partial [Arenimonas sp.]
MRRHLASAIALALAGVSSCLAAPAATAPDAVQTTTQLPRNVRPSHYEIAVVPHASSLSFDGQATISIDVLEPTSSITLNALDLEFTSVRLAPADGKGQASTPTVTLDAKAQTATFTFAQPLAVGRYQLAMEYTGKIGTQASGMFAIDYENKAGKQRALFTQFEAADARRFVPSWDEPSYKATFDLTATVPAGQLAVSNMPVAKATNLDGGLQQVSFRTSPKMSTYLLFFGTGNLERATINAGPTEIGVVTQSGSLAQAQFALESSRDVLQEYNAYFDIAYPLPKLDNIASPGRSQFFGAMENWG